MLQSVVSTSKRILLHNQIKGGGPPSPRQLVNALAKAELAIFQTENRGNRQVQVQGHFAAAVLHAYNLLWNNV